MRRQLRHRRPPERPQPRRRHGRTEGRYAARRADEKHSAGRQSEEESLERIHRHRHLRRGEEGIGREKGLRNNPLWPVQHLQI